MFKRRGCFVPVFVVKFRNFKEKKMKIPKKILLSILALLIITVGAFAYFGYQNGSEDIKLDDPMKFGKFITGEQTRTVFDNALQSEKQIEGKPDETPLYHQAALYWKGLGDLTGNKEFYSRAIKLIKIGMQKQDGETSVGYLNLGNLYMLLGDHEEAEELYEKGIINNPGDPSLYSALARLYDEKMKKSVEEVIAVYERGVRTIAQDNVNFIIEYAGYLANHDRIEEALKYYRLLAQKYPTEKRFQDRVQELEQLK